MRRRVLAALVLLGAGCNDLGLLQSECKSFNCESEPLDMAAPVSPGGQDLAQPADLWPPADLQANPYALDPLKGASVQTGCAAGHLGWPLAPLVTACLMGSNQPPASCNAAANWSPCSQLPLDASTCAAVPWGFFMSGAHGRQTGSPPDPSMKCYWAGGDPANDQRYIFGCGASRSGLSYNALPPGCGGFTKTVACKSSNLQPANPWTCSLGSPPGDNDIDGVFAADPTDGVLCCHP